MITIQNPKVIKEIQQIAGLTLADGIPNKMGDSVIPVIDVNPKHNKQTLVIEKLTSVTTGAQVVYTPPAHTRFYITAVSLSAAYDAAADSTDTNIVAYIDGISRSIIGISKITLTADAQTANLNFPFPIKTTKGSSIMLNKAFTVGAGVMRAIVYGYFEEDFEGK